jgi:ABC-type multidrug transport system ATPase subunit/pSer/pThr/pTyr-binding forkhead associated (FHA) protein
MRVCITRHSRENSPVDTHLHVRAAGREAVFATGLREIWIGSARGCAIRLTDPSVAPKHLVLRNAEDRWVLQTVSAEHPVFDAGRPLDSTTIDAPLALRIGDPSSGPLLEIAPAIAELRDVTIDFASGPATGPSDTRTSALGFELTADVLRIGRDPESDVVVDDVLVSRRHAEIRRRDDGRYEAIDVGSHNGTFVNGRRIERAVLEQLDVVGIGRNSYRLRDGRLEEYVDSGEVAFAAVDLTVRLPNGTILLDGASFSLDSRSLLAVIGPSGSGKSTLIAALTGARMADQGDVRYGERSLYADYAALRQRIGYVPQADVVHAELPVRRALEFTADLRFPSDVDQAERHRRVDQVMKELGIVHRLDIPVARLSGGERKRVNVGLELLTAPSLLFLDEPTTGLDPNYERSLMELFRQLADHGRSVVVATHSVDSLRLCDRVLVLAPGGSIAYFGPPQLALAYFDQRDFADVFRELVEPGGGDWGARFRVHPYYASYVERDAPTVIAPAADRSTEPVRTRDGWHQFTTLTRRYAAVIAADRRNLALVIAQAPLLGLLLLFALPGNQLSTSTPGQLRLVSQAGVVLIVVVLGVSWLGISNSVGEIAKELPLYRRERAAGLSVAAYLGSKVCVLGAITVVQAAVLLALALGSQHGPARAVVLGWPLGELMVVAALTGIAAMATGLLTSAVARTPDRATSVLPIVLVFLLVLALGGVVPQIGNKPVLRQLGYVASTRWGFAGMASTSDLNDLQAVNGALTRTPTFNVDDPNELFNAFHNNVRGDPLWDHTSSAWLADVGALLGLTVIALLGTGFVLRRELPV